VLRAATGAAGAGASGASAAAEAGAAEAAVAGATGAGAAGPAGASAASAGAAEAAEAASAGAVSVEKLRMATTSSTTTASGERSTSREREVGVGAEQVFLAGERPGATIEGGGLGGTIEGEGLGGPIERGGLKDTTIDIIPFASINVSTWRRKYLWPRRPVLLKGGAVHLSAYNTWTARYLHDHPCSQHNVSVGIIPYAGQYGINGSMVPLRQYIEHAMLRDGATVMHEGLSTNTSVLSDLAQAVADGTTLPPDCVFDSKILNRPPNMASPSGSSRWRVCADLASSLGGLLRHGILAGHRFHPLQLAIGPTGSGAPPHFHADAVNALYSIHPLHTYYTLTIHSL
jgi:hypothetical protein